MIKTVEESNSILTIGDWDAKGTYINYFQSGMYDRRYPLPNRRTLGIVLKYAGTSKNILDYGCGNGRYTIPLLQMTSSKISAYDICPEAIRQLKQCVQGLGFDTRISYLSSEKDLDTSGTYDLILGLFGVLSHICGVEKRQRMLMRIFNLLEDDGTLIISVPNAGRRFNLKQFKYAHLRQTKADPKIPSEVGDIIYERRLKNKTSAFYYHLYTVYRLKSELKSAGFTPSIITSESVFPESWIVRSSLYSKIDNFLSAFFPARLGYGILITASKAQNFKPAGLSLCKRYKRTFFTTIIYSILSCFRTNV